MWQTIVLCYAMSHNVANNCAMQCGKLLYCYAMLYPCTPCYKMHKLTKCHPQTSVIQKKIDSIHKIIWRFPATQQPSNQNKHVVLNTNSQNKDHVPRVQSPQVATCKSELKTRRAGHSDLHHCATGAHIPRAVRTAWPNHEPGVQPRPRPRPMPRPRAPRPTVVHGGAQPGSETLHAQTGVDATSEPTGWTSDSNAARVHWPHASDATGRHSVARNAAAHVHLHSGADDPDPGRHHNSDNWRITEWKT